MPTKGMSPKQVMSTEMHKFGEGKLHSGSKKGPVVKSRKQAVAIGMSEARRRPGHGGPDPIERSVAAADVGLPRTAPGIARGSSTAICACRATAARIRSENDDGSNVAVFRL